MFDWIVEGVSRSDIEHWIDVHELEEDSQLREFLEGIKDTLDEYYGD